MSTLKIMKASTNADQIVLQRISCVSGVARAQVTRQFHLFGLEQRNEASSNQYSNPEESRAWLKNFF